MADSGGDDPADDTWRGALDALPVGIALLEPDGRCRYANAALRAMLALPDGPVRLDPGAATPALDALLADAAVAPERRIAVGDRELDAHVVALAGGLRLLALVAPLDPEPAAAELGLQRLDAFARLARGVAHDFQNLLTAIRLSAELMSQRGPRNEADRSDLEAIQTAVTRANDVVSQIVEFGRPRGAELEEIDLEALVRAMGPVLQSLTGPEIPIALDLRGPALVLAERVRLERALVNLVVNGRDAMPTGGPLAIRIAPVRLGARSQGRLLGAPSGRYVALSVRDAGSGMDAATRSRAVEPFFSTKKGRWHLGLGLSVVHAAAESCGGDLAIESAPGRGTEVTLFLPATGIG